MSERARKSELIMRSPLNQDIRKAKTIQVSSARSKRANSAHQFFSEETKAGFNDELLEASKNLLRHFQVSPRDIKTATGFDYLKSPSSRQLYQQDIDLIRDIYG